MRFGAGGEDTLIGGGNNSVLDGGGLHDHMTAGAAGLDIIFGGAGNDTIFGNDGADTIGPGAGNDLINGSAQADDFTFGVGYRSDRINAYAHGEDDILLDQQLWLATAGMLTEEEVVDIFGTINGTGTEITLDFQNGGVLVIASSAGIDLGLLVKELEFFG